MTSLELAEFSVIPITHLHLPPTGDFSGPAESTSFPLGSFIPIMASVAQKTHQPLLLLLEECVAATTPELQPESSIYPIIANKGYPCYTGNKD